MFRSLPAHTFGAGSFGLHGTWLREEGSRGALPCLNLMLCPNNMSFRSGNGEYSEAKVERALLTAKPFVIAVASLLLFLAVWVVVATYPIAMAGHVDFRHLYTAGYMVRTSQGALLYDHRANEELQNRLVSPAPGGFTFNHLAYEALVYAPFSYLTYRRAYACVLVVNLLVLAGTVRMLWPYFSPLGETWRFLPVAVVVCFLPVAFALAEGQDSLILLALVVASLVAMDHRRECLAGALLGLTLFKFQYALPIALLFLVWRRWQFLEGFMASGSLASGLSLWLTGLFGMKKYFPYLLSISTRYSAEGGIHHGIHPEGMANLRGLVALIAGGSNPKALPATLLLSAIVIAWVGFKHSSLPAALLTAVLVSYHHVISDACLLVVPLGLILLDSVEHQTPRKRQAALLAFVCLTGPAVLLFTGAAFCLLTLPLLGLLVLWEGDHLRELKNVRAR